MKLIPRTMALVVMIALPALALGQENRPGGGGTGGSHGSGGGSARAGGGAPATPGKAE